MTLGFNWGVEIPRRWLLLPAHLGKVEDKPLASQRVVCFTVVHWDSHWVSQCEIGAELILNFFLRTPAQWALLGFLQCARQEPTSIGMVESQIGMSSQQLFLLSHWTSRPVQTLACYFSQDDSQVSFYFFLLDCFTWKLQSRYCFRKANEQSEA